MYLADTIEFKGNSLGMDSDALRELIAVHGKLLVDIGELDDNSNLFEAGLTSLNTVNLMLAIEDQYDIVFTDESLTRDTFSSVNALLGIVRGLRDAA